MSKNEVSQVAKGIVTKNKGGRTAKYNKDTLIECVSGYLQQCNDKDEIPLKAGFCVYAGICRDTYNEYKKKKELSDTLKKLELMLEMEITKALVDKTRTNSGIIFYLKNAFGWRDKQEIKTDIRISINKPSEYL